MTTRFPSLQEGARRKRDSVLGSGQARWRLPKAFSIPTLASHHLHHLGSLGERRQQEGPSIAWVPTVDLTWRFFTAE